MPTLYKQLKSNPNYTIHSNWDFNDANDEIYLYFTDEGGNNIRIRYDVLYEDISDVLDELALVFDKDWTLSVYKEVKKIMCHFMTDVEYEES